ncbi:hypothetical protein L1987_64653 [Smallanthus sonchifolius]|uniref:Uncharacterized protein n=1 Tax=Smallanthus sonchifolius TaxID=185202 RepID=A0ACB9BSE0_9ASTR|nr:hypothetical protein L1987_64653 [Smallanthus sonchifolius]
MLKQLKFERDLEENIKQLSYEEMEMKSEEKVDEKHIEDSDFLYKTNRLCMKRTNGSIFYLKSIKEVLDLPIGDIKQMIHLKEVGKNILSKENDTIICIKKVILDEENMQPKYDQTQHNDKVGEWVSGVKYKETCAEVQTSEKNNSQKSHEGSHDGEPIYDETPQTISSIINKDAELDSKQGHEEKVQGKLFGKMSFEPPTFKLISQLTPKA